MELHILINSNPPAQPHLKQLQQLIKQKWKCFLKFSIDNNNNLGCTCFESDTNFCGTNVVCCVDVCNKRFTMPNFKIIFFFYSFSNEFLNADALFEAFICYYQCVQLHCFYEMVFGLKNLNEKFCNEDIVLLYPYRVCVYTDTYTQLCWIKLKVLCDVSLFTIWLLLLPSPLSKSRC